MSITKRTRYEVLRRDNHTCRYCGHRAPDIPITVDHVVPESLGGSDEPSNLVAACSDCNSGKASTSPDAPLVADVDQKAAEWAQAMTQVIEQRNNELAARQARVARFDEYWSGYIDSRLDEPYPRDHNWRQSVRRFMAYGLSDEFLAEAVDIAMGNSKIPARDLWRYFCGICNNEVKTVREQTAAAVAPAPEQEAPAGCAKGFPYMDMFDGFLDALCDALKVSREGRKVADWALWDAMPEAYRVFQQDHTAWCDPEDCDVYAEAREHFEGCIAPSMHRLGEIEGTR